MPSKEKSGCHRCHELQDRLLRMEQSAFDNLQKLSDGHEQMRLQWQKSLGEKSRLESENHQLQQQLNTANQTIHQLESQIAARLEQHNQMTAKLKDIQKSLQNTPH
ncbi:MAG: hypothetical protein VKI83_00320 [Synechococcaceae cyanobacterium]|nr:hypothetical protein [Synechococcaceae cyanobacterium]